mgnify:CR=1 FL=1
MDFEKLSEAVVALKEAGSEIEKLLAEAKEAGKLPYRISKEIRKNAQDAKLAAQDIRMIAMDLFKGQK